LALPGVNIGGGNFQRRRWRTLRWLGPQRVRLDGPKRHRPTHRSHSRCRRSAISFSIPG